MKATAEKVKESGIHSSDADTGSFQHIEGLKAGDKLRFLGGIPQKTLKKGETITVYRVLEKEEICSEDHSQILRRFSGERVPVKSICWNTNRIPATTSA
jgi:hypothetical protein